MHVKLFIKYVLYYAPWFLKPFIRTLSKQVEVRRAKKRQYRTTVSKDEIHRIINGLQLDCDVMLHTSKINIGSLEGGTAYVADEILKKVDLEHNTLLVSALPYRGAFADYLKQHIVFDVRTAPIAMGSINRYIASMPDVYRSIHPTHSVVAIGRDAEKYIAEHHIDTTPFGMHSPYYKLIMNRGKVVLFGATLNNLTCICAVEDMLGTVYADHVYSPKEYVVKCIDDRGKELYVTTKCHDPKKAIKRSLLFIREDLIQEGIMQVYPIGEAEVSVIDIKAFAIYYLRLLDSGVSNRGSITVSNELHDKIQDTIDKLLR